MGDNAAYTQTDVPEIISEYLAICVIVKNNPKYLSKWIKYHMSLGIKYMFVIDVSSEPELVLQAVTPFLSETVMSYRYLPSLQTLPPNWLFDSHLAMYNENFHFLGFLRDNEFMVFHPDDKKPLAKLAQEEVIGLYTFSGGISLAAIDIHSTDKCTRSKTMRPIINTRQVDANNQGQYHFKPNITAVTADYNAIQGWGSIKLTDLPGEHLFKTWYLHRYVDYSSSPVLSDGTLARCTSVA